MVPLPIASFALVIWHKEIQNQPNHPREGDCCGGDAKKPERFG